jgi:hypothetical protein
MMLPQGAISVPALNSVGFESVEAAVEGVVVSWNRIYLSHVPSHAIPLAFRCEHDRQGGGFLSDDISAEDSLYGQTAKAFFFVIYFQTHGFGAVWQMLTNRREAPHRSRFADVVPRRRNVEQAFLMEGLVGLPSSVRVIPLLESEPCEDPRVL